MKISLIGMSGAGKTYWSKILEKKGFKRYCCDDMIEIKLDKELKESGYIGGIKDVAKWMGQPFEKQHKINSKKYLRFEEKVMIEVFKEIEFNFSEDIVIDTTGSVIYTRHSIQAKLEEVTKIIHLEVSDEMKKNMYKLYLKDPKPVFWGESFSSKGGETNIESLKRCYPELLAYRIKQYEELSHFALGYHQILEKQFLH